MVDIERKVRYGFFREGKIFMKHLHYYEVSLKVENLDTPEASLPQTICLLSLTASV